jgi:exodeoxyribonuclease-3
MTMVSTEQTITLLSWNVNGIRAAHRKGFLDWLVETQPDILCLQETRAEETQLPATLAQPEGYRAFWNSSRRKKGYSGTALLTRTEPVDVQFGLGVEEFDQEGRTIVAQYPSFTLINCYFPNGGRDHSRVPFKMAFYDAFLDRCEALRSQGHALIFCGDVNTAHREIDLAHPKANENTTGFLPEERAWLDRIVETGYVDTFRHFRPDETEQYTWWSMPTRARERNVGWRIDYFFVVAEILDRVADAFILPEVMGSDHCPVGLVLRGSGDTT